MNFINQISNVAEMLCNFFKTALNPTLIAAPFEGISEVCNPSIAILKALIPFHELSRNVFYMTIITHQSQKLTCQQRLLIILIKKGGLVLRCCC